MNAPHPPPAGWYPDPSGRAPFRYWDGQQWTEHTNQGTAPAPSVAQPAPAAPAAPGYLGAPAAFAPGPAAAPVATGGPLTGQSFVDDLKKLEGYALVAVGAVLFILFSFLTWADAKKTYPTGQSFESSSNAWDGDGAWLIRGWEVDLDNLNKIESGLSVDSGTDMVILLPLALIAAGLALAVRMGKPVQYAREGALGASVILAGLMIGEVFHLNSVIDDAKSIYAPNGISFDGGVGFGMYLATLATLAMAVGAARTYMAAKKTAG